MNKLSKEEIENLKETLKDVDLDTTNQSLIKDNKIIFIYNGQVYRCKMPNQKIQAEAESEQNRMRVSMYKRDDTITRKQLIKVLKEKQNIDILDLEKQKEKIKEELFDVMIDLSNTSSEETDRLDELIAEKRKIEEQMMDVTIEIVGHLSPCIEEQAKQAFYGYLTHACTERVEDKKQDTWKRVWDSYEDYQNDDQGLPIVALQKMHSLILYLSE